jgi:hypothetical protein
MRSRLDGVRHNTRPAAAVPASGSPSPVHAPRPRQRRSPGDPQWISERPQCFKDSNRIDVASKLDQMATVRLVAHGIVASNTTSRVGAVEGRSWR